MLTPEYKALFPDVSLNEKNVRTLTENPVRNSDVFDVIYNGSVAGRYSSTTINGAISGRGFTLGIIDDPIKGAEAAQSVTQKRKAIDWYNAEFSRRKAPNAAIIVMTTRWADDDLVGYLLSTAKSNARAEQWSVITLPGMYEEDRPQPYDIRTKDGEGLWLDHYGQEHYEIERESMDTYFWNALIQQRPSSREGNVFKRSWYLDKNGKPWAVPYLNGSLKKVVAYWDLAYSDNPKADQTSGVLSLLDSTNFEWVQEVNAGRWNIKDRNDEILRSCLRWNAIFNRLPVWLESGMGAGVADVQELQRLLIANGINALIDNVKGGKVVRANASTEIGSFMSASQSGIIRFCEGDWTEPTLYELSRLIYKETATGTEFTGGKKDRLDSLVGAHRKLTAPQPINYFSNN